MRKLKDWAKSNSLLNDRSIILGIFTEEGKEDHCLDCDKTKRISESEAYEITKRIMKGKPVAALLKMDQEARQNLSHLRNDGLSLRQICRITGFPFHIVRKA